MAAREGAVLLTAAPRSRGVPLLRGLRLFVSKEPVGAIAGAGILLMIAAVLIGPEITPFDPVTLSLRDKFISPGLGTNHWLGTDQLGRDTLSRVLHGGRVSLGTSFGALTLGVLAGSLLGLVSGYLGGRVDQLFQRTIDGLMAIPPLILALAMATALGNSVFNVLIAVAVVMLPNVARIARSATLSVRATDYTQAAVAMGATTPWIIARHIAPNVAGTIVTIASIWVGNIVLIEASLGFLGVGITPPNPSWGNMLSGEGRSYMQSAPWLALVPGVFISLTVLCSNMFGDALRTFVDPKIRRRG